MSRIPILRRFPGGLLKPVLIGAVLALVVAWGVGELLEPGRWPVRQVEIRGDGQRADRDAVRETALKQVSDGLLHTDVRRLGRALEAVDWVDRVAVRRLWPDRLQLTLTEHRPVARWGDDAWLNDRGETFRAATRLGLDALPQMHAPERDAETILRRYRSVLDRLGATGPRIVRVDVDRRLAWRLRLDNGVVLKLGRDDLDRRAGRFAQAWSGLLAPHADRIRHIDLRYPHGLAVAWKTTES